MISTYSLICAGVAQLVEHAPCKGRVGGSSPSSGSRELLSIRATQYADLMEHPKAIGDRTALATIQALQESGCTVSVPFGENVRYDLVIDDGETLARVQCKTGRLRRGAVRFATCSCYGHHARPSQSRRDYMGQIDYFAVYCPETTGVYLIPIEDVCTRSQAALRIEPSRNHQLRGVRLAEKYELARVSVRATQAPRATSGAR